MIVIALHGFLGAPSDWTAALASLDPRYDIDLITPDLSVWATRAELAEAPSFSTFAKAFNTVVRKRRDETQDTIVLAGYSMGGRLAAACLLEDDELYTGALLVSTHFGLSADDTSGREARRASDRSWAERLRREAWVKTWEDWNLQPVLKPGTRVGAKEAAAAAQHGLARRNEGRREAWARALELWSLADQADVRQPLAGWVKAGGALTLMTGTDDSKFSALAAAWAKSQSAVRHRTVLGAGHRILLEAREDVASELGELLDRIGK